MWFLAEGVQEGIRLLAEGHPETWSAIRVSVGMSGAAMAISLALGTPLGFLLGFTTFPGKRLVRMLVETSLSIPTVVIGLLVYAFISRRGPLGDFGLLFTIEGMILGEVLLALPIVIALTAQSVESLDARLPVTLRTLGASPLQEAMTCLLEARHGLMLAGVTAFGRVFSEIGICMMLGGNIKWHTRTITTAIALETGKGEFAQGIALGLVLMCIALLVNIVLTWLRRRGEA